MTEIVKELLDELDTTVFYGVNNVNIRLIYFVAISGYSALT